VWSLVGLAQTAEDPAADHYYRGNALYNRKMFILAVEEYKLFLGQHASHAKAEQARHGMALSYYSMRKYAEAEPMLKALIEKGQAGDKEQLGLLRGQCLLQLDRPAEAEAVFAVVVRSRSEEAFRNAIAGVLESQYRQQKWTECMATADTLLGAEPTPAYRRRALYQAAYACYQLEKFEQALPYLEKLQPLIEGDPMAPQATFFLAESYRQTGKLDEAAAKYAAAVTGFKGAVAAEVYYRLGFVRFTQQKYDEAIEAFDQSIKTEKGGAFSDEALLYLGRSWLEKKEYTKAIQYLQPLSGKSKPGTGRKPRKRTSATAEPNVQAALWLARAYSRQGKHENAATILAEAIPKHSHSILLPDLLFDHGNALMVRERFAEASASFAKILPMQDWPQMNDVMRLHAVCLHRARDYQNSLKSADQFLAGFNSDKLVADVLFVKAENLYFLNELDDAAGVYSHFLSTYPTHSSAGAATFRLGQIHHKKGLWAEAVKVIAPLLAKQPEGKVYSQLNFIAGDCHFRLENWREAVTNLEPFVKARNLPAKKNPRLPPPSEPNIDSALIELSISHLNMGNTTASVGHLKTLIEHFPKSPHAPLALSELGRLQYEAKELKPAWQTLQAFVQSFPAHAQRPKVEYYLGWIALDQGQEAEAEKHFQVVVTSYPRDTLAPDAALQLGLVQVSQEKYKEARQTFERLMKTYPDHPRMDLATFSLGVAHARMESWNTAAPYFQKVAEEFGESEIADRAVYEWAWCEKGMKRNEAAVQRYSYLLKTYPQTELRHKATTEMAELTFGAGQYDKAIAQLIDTLGKLKDPAVKEQTLYRLGTAYYSKGDFEKSAETFETFLQEYPQSSLRGSALFQAGESRMKVKEMKVACDHFLAASKVSGLAAPLSESILVRLGEVQGLTKQWRESAASYKKLLQAHPETKWGRNARFGTAWALEKQDQFPQAMAEYKAVIDPKRKDLLSARAQFQIGECLFAQKEYDEAIRALVPVQVSYRYKEWAAKALLETGRIMEAKGDNAAAAEQFKEVVRKFPDDNAAVVAKNRLDALRREP